MEKVVGYGFHPTNEQLVDHYLRMKRLNPDYSHPDITEMNINDHEPSELLGESDASERYLFVAPRYTNTKRKLVKRRTRGGTWKATGKNPDVKNKRSKEVIGSKRKLVFYEGPSTRNKNARTNYVMDELHCNPDPLFKADFVVVRIKIKPNDSCDSSTTSESAISHQLTSDSGDLIAEVSQVESQQLPNNDMSCNSEDYSGDIMFSKDFPPLKNHDISPDRISQPLSHGHISLNRKPDLPPNHDISSNGESLTLSNQDIYFNQENQPLPNNDLSFIIESLLPLPNNNLCSILVPHQVTSFNREVQPPANYNLPSILSHHEISTNREFQQLNYDISFNREYQPQPHDISSNGEFHVVPNYNVSSISPHQDISISNRESQPPLNHSLYPIIEDLVTKNTSTEVEPLLVPPVWDSVNADNGLDHNSFYTQQMQIHLQQQVCNSLIEYNELDENSFPAQQMQLHLQQQVCNSLIESNELDENSFPAQQMQLHLQQQVCNSLIEYNELDENSFPAQQMQLHLQQGSSHSCSDSNVLNTPLGSEWEIYWSNLQWDVHSEKESGLSHTPDFDSTKPATGAAYVYSSSDESALLNGDCSLLNSPLGSEQENNRSNSQWDVLDEFYGKEPVHSRPTVFNLSMPVTEAYASQQQLYSDATLIDDPLLYGFSPMRENMASIACINNNYIPMRR
ncbi:hypothetical protein LWI29_021206 [Acer saccharum]|uniref:NAC domain-containing protein n=1 Tax=Acer saccharum TaxID=4024 RepID=A0AA39SD32_ACESA|nr:hypothetical protein LWI29_021206 [Acer saccharum]